MKKKITVAAILSGVAILSFLFGALVGGSFGNRTASVPEENKSEEFVFNISENNNIKLISEVIEGEAMPYEMRSNYKFIAAYRLQATVTGAEDTSVSYSITYKDGTPVESDIVSYITDGSSLFVGFFKKFNQTVVVTATSNANPNAIASCEIDCYKEYIGSNFEIEFCGSITYVENGGTYYIDSDYQLSIELRQPSRDS